MRTQEGYSLDAVGKVVGAPFDVEVDGPSHFLKGTRKPIGATLLKWRQVPHFRKRPLVEVPYWEWDRLSSEEAKRKYLFRKVLDAIVQR